MHAVLQALLHVLDKKESWLGGRVRICTCALRRYVSLVQLSPIHGLGLPPALHIVPVIAAVEHHPSIARQVGVAIEALGGGVSAYLIGLL